MSVLFVAEMGSQHKGNIALACRYAYEMKSAGADILKMQFGHDPADPVRHVSAEMAHTVAGYCNSIGLEFMASLFSLEGLALARDIGMQRYKIAHQKNGEAELVREITAGGHETFIAYTYNEVPVSYSGSHYVFTTDKYPTYRVTMPSAYAARGTWYGYSDHTIGIGACLLAVARGAQYIEKHVCMSPDDLWTKDTSFSSTPAQFSELVRLGREIEQVRDATV